MSSSLLLKPCRWTLKCERARHHGAAWPLWHRQRCWCSSAYMRYGDHDQQQGEQRSPRCGSRGRACRFKGIKRTAHPSSHAMLDPRSPLPSLTAHGRALSTACVQVPVDWLLQKADLMFPEGVGARKAFAKEGVAAEIRRPTSSLRTPHSQPRSSLSSAATIQGSRTRSRRSWDTRSTRTRRPPAS